MLVRKPLNDALLAVVFSKTVTTSRAIGDRHQDKSLLQCLGRYPNAQNADAIQLYGLTLDYLFQNLQCNNPTKTPRLLARTLFVQTVH